MESPTPEATSFNQTTVDWRRPPPRIDPDNTPAWSADTAAVERFQEDGATFLRGVFDEWVELLRAGLELNLRTPHRAHRTRIVTRILHNALSGRKL